MSHMTVWSWISVRLSFCFLCLEGPTRSPEEGETSRCCGLTIRDEHTGVEALQVDMLCDFGLVTHPLVPECPQL